MMRQTFAIFLDSYRELSSRKLFWISMILSGVFVALFAATGLNSKGITFFGWVLPIPLNSNWVSPRVFYKLMFIEAGVKLWLSWGAMILALISTASLVPEFVSSGSIELSLSRPISRVRIFLTKYSASLLFVGLQVMIFSLASFLVIGLRGDSWEPRIFLAVPLVLLVFSYLYCVSAIVGLTTKSTIFALITAALFWVGLFSLNVADNLSLKFGKETEVKITAVEKSIPNMERAAKATIAKQFEPGSDPAITAAYSPEAAQGNPTAADLAKANPVLATRQKELEELKDKLETQKKWNTGFYISKALLPKTSETTELLSRSLLTDEDIKKILKADDEEDIQYRDRSEYPDTAEGRRARFEASRDIDQQSTLKAGEEMRSRSLWYVIGGSLAFEAFVLAIATWIFSRRDF